MIIMIQMKLLNLQNLNSKINNIERIIGVILIPIGELMLYNSYIYEVNLNLSIWQKYNPTFNYFHGIWTIPLILGMILFLDSLYLIPEFPTKKEIYKKIKNKIKEGKKELINYSNNFTF